MLEVSPQPWMNHKVGGGCSLSKTIIKNPGRQNKSNELSVLDQLTPVTCDLYLTSARGVLSHGLAERGIKCVICASSELPRLSIPGVEVIKIHIMDSPYSNLYAYFDSVADKINEVQRTGGRSLVHCIAGVSRSASLVMAYLMKYQSLSLKSAYSHVKTCRPIIRPNDGFFQQLIEYEIQLFGTQTVHMVYNHMADRMIPDVYEDDYNGLIKYKGLNYRSNGVRPR